MNLKDSDLVIDEYGNYYMPIMFKNGYKEVVLANAFMKYSMERRFDFDEDSEMKTEFARFNHKPFGSVALDKLQSFVEMRENGSLTSHIYNLQDVMKNYEVKFKKLNDY